MLLMVGLAGVVMLAVAHRCGGASLVWYDEVAAIMLVRLTYLWRRARLAETRALSFIPIVPLALVTSAVSGRPAADTSRV